MTASPLNAVTARELFNACDGKRDPRARFRALEQLAGFEIKAA